MSRPMLIEIVVSPAPFDGSGSSGETFYDVLFEGHRYKSKSVKYEHDALQIAADLRDAVIKCGHRAVVRREDKP